MERTIISNASIFDGTGRAPVPGHVMIEGERVVEVREAPPGSDPGFGGTSPGALAEAGARTIDAAGATLMPGLVEGHGHISFIDQAELTELSLIGLEEHTLATMHNARKLLDAGFTSVNSAASARIRLDAVIRDEIDAGRIPGPRLRAASPEITVTSGLGDADRMHVQLHTFGLVANGVDEIVRTVRTCLREGADNIKLNISGDVFLTHADSFSTVMAEDEVRAAVETAHAHGRRVAAHCRSAGSVLRALRQGVDMIYHCDHADEEALDGLEAAKDRVLTGPAIGVILGAIDALEGAMEASDGAEDHRAAIAELRRVHEDNCRTYAEVRRRGIPVVIGGDYGFAVNPQGTNARDLQHFVEQYGYTGAEALRCGTMIGARAMCREHELGQVRAGFLADLLLVDGDPTGDVRLLQDRSRLLMIMKGGSIHAERLARRTNR